MLYTEAGVSLVARELPYRLAGIELSIRGIHGSLAHGLRIERLEVHQRRVHLTFSDIRLDLDLAPALLQTLHARNLEIGNLHIEVLHRTTPYVPTPLYFLPHWLSVRIDALHVARGTLVLPSGQQSRPRICAPTALSVPVRRASMMPRCAMTTASSPRGQGRCARR